MKIKKVDDKPMVIHTKQKAKIHTHEPKQASIKGSNIYTVDRDPTKKKGAEGSHRKSTVHKVSKDGKLAMLRNSMKNANQSKASSEERHCKNPAWWEHASCTLRRSRKEF